MNEWLTNLLVAVILLCVWILAVLYYLSKMDRKKNLYIKRKEELSF